MIYPAFLSAPRSIGFSSIEDQQCAGALMWTCVTVVYLIAATVYAARLLSPHRSDERIPQFEVQSITALHADPQRVEVI